MYNTPRSQKSFLVLLLFLLAILMVYPFILKRPYGGIVLQILMSAMLLASLVSLRLRRKALIVGVLLMLPSLIFGWINHFSSSSSFSLSTQFASSLCNVIFLTYVVAVLCRHVFLASVVTTNLIYAGLCIYLLTGIIWAMIYLLIELFIPGSFQGALSPVFQEGKNVNPGEILHNFLYYSYVTMTTLGYGDLTPQYPPAKSLAVLQAIIGQFYITTLIARLVGLQLMQQKRGRER